MYVYVVPAPTQEGVSPLGGDVRYLISPDGTRIVEKRQLHKSIIENPPLPPGAKRAAGYHTHVLDHVPEDTDVFHVLTRTPSVPEYVASSKYMYVVNADGTIVFLGETDKVLKNGGKEKKH